MGSRESTANDDLLHSAIAQLAESGHFPIAFGGFAVGPHGRQGRPNAGAVTITTLIGNRRDSLVGLRVESDRGLGGRAMSEGRPRITTDYQASRHITHDYDEAVLGEGIRSLLAVPIIVGGTNRGVIYGGVHAETFVGTVLAEPAIHVANQLSKELDVREEVERRLMALRVEAEAETDVARLSSTQLAELREGVAELRGIASSVTDDPDLRSRIAAVERRLGALSGGRGARTPDVALAPREIDVLGYVAVGASNAEIGRALRLAESTVKAYLGTAMTKLGASSRFQAVQLARRAGLLP